MRGAEWSRTDDGSVWVVGTIGGVSVPLTIAPQYVDLVLSHLGVAPTGEPLPPRDVEVETAPNGRGRKRDAGFLRLVS